MTRRLQIRIDVLGRRRVQWHIPALVALAVDVQVADTTPVLQVTHRQTTEFGPAQPVIEQSGQNRPVT